MPAQPFAHRGGAQFIQSMLRIHGDLAGCIRGVHLHQSISGDYVETQMKRGLPDLPKNYLERFQVAYQRILRIDRHLSFAYPEQAKQVLDELDQRTQTEQIGFVMQSPENQVVTDKVWHELAFGLESLGYDTPTIRRRVAEMASFFGIEDWFYKNVTELSGGQKQLLNLAAIMVMQPSLLILDEPTAQLDPIVASDFLATIGKINRELGTTIILTEHRLEEVFPMCNRVMVMDRGQMICDGPPANVGERLRDRGHAMFLAMPVAMRIWAAAPSESPCPTTVRDGRNWLNSVAQHGPWGATTRKTTSILLPDSD